MQHVLYKHRPQFYTYDDFVGVPFIGHCDFIYLIVTSPGVVPSDGQTGACDVLSKNA
jgi:hypothetical protein